MATAGRSLSSMSEETFDFICTSCDQENKTLEAVRYCVECLGYCCQFCTDLHKKFPALRNHNLVDVGQGYQAGNQKPTLPEFPTERCGEHHDKVLDMYCEKHDVVGCYICLSKDHRSCPESQFYSISDMVDKLFNLSISKQTKQHLKEMMVSVASICDSKDVQLAKLIVAKNESLRKVTEFQKALEAAIKRAAEMSKKELEDMYKQLEEEILQDKTEVKKIEDVLRNTSDNIKKAEGNRAQGFVLTKLAEAQMKEADDHMSKLKTLTDVQLSFTPSQSLMDYINGKQGLGEVLCPSKKTTDQTVIDYGAQGIGEVVGPSKKTTVQTVIDYGAQGIGEVVGPSKKTTDRTVIDYGAQGIGEVVRPTKKRTDLYKVKGSKDINIKLSGDSFDCQSLDCCLTLDNNQLLLTDKNNKKLKRFDVKTMTVIDHCNLDGTPRGVCCVGTDEAIVACEFPRMIQFVSIDKKVIPTRQIKMSHDCYGIATKDNKLYITDYESSVYIYDMLGNLLKTISQDNAGNKLFSSSRHIAFNDSGNMYVSCRSGIVCLDNAENYVSTYNDDDLINTDGLCGDGRRNIFVVGCISHNVVQFNEEGKKMGVVIKQQDGLQFPHSLCFHQRLNRLFVSMNSDVLKMYELE